MNSGEGKIEIPLEDFWEIVNKFHDHESCEILFGVPKVNKDNQTLEINYAYSSHSHPSEWVGGSVAKNEWEDE